MAARPSGARLRPQEGVQLLPPREGRPFANARDRSDQLLVAASPNDEVADTHWYREDFDFFLLKEAQAAGVRYFDRVAPARRGARDRGMGDLLRKRGRETPLSIRAAFLVDASGREGALTAALGAGDARARRASFDAIAFHPLSRASGASTELPDFESSETPPYPVDDAAVHHVFPGGWIWVLRFSNGITSAGVAAEDWLARELRLEEGELAWSRLLARFPSISAQFAGARAARPFVHAPRLGFRRARAAGDGWALLPSAAAFADPLLSTGFPLALLGIQRLGLALDGGLGHAALRRARRREIGETTLAEADAAARLVGRPLRGFDDFRLFAALSKLYFAAASYAEAARRLGKPHLANSFLLSKRSRPTDRALRRICARRGGPLDARTAAPASSRRSRGPIEPFDVAGLLDASRRNWYPVDADDLRAARPEARGDARGDRAPPRGLGIRRQRRFEPPSSSSGLLRSASASAPPPPSS